MKILYLYLLLIQFSACLFANDTLYIKENTVIINNITKYSSLEDVKLINEKKFFSGYLIIQIDSNSKIEYLLSGGEIFKTPVYWVENLDSIENDNSKFYFNPLFSILSDGERRYDDGKRDDLSVFIHFYNLFNYNNRPEIVSYLYPFSYQFLTTSLIFNTNIWERKINGPKYIIYKTSFYTSILYFVNYNKKIFIPISRLLSLTPVSYDEIAKHHYLLSYYVILKK